MPSKTMFAEAVMLRRNVWIKILVLTNVVLLLFLTIISLHYNVPQIVLSKMGIIENNPINYLHYNVRNSLFSAYTNKDYRIVMLGDSITERAAWNELLGLTEIANRGIDGDTTEGFYKRLSNIYSLKPELCFIMGGINDILQGVPVETILNNMEKITEGLKQNGIEPIIQSTLYVSKTKVNWNTINRKVDELNKMLKEMCVKNGILFVEINELLSANGALKDEYTYDGIHLHGTGYREWGKKIMEIMSFLAASHTGLRRREPVCNDFFLALAWLRRLDKQLHGIALA
jgi:lysophospholipase L1-like esterase